MADLSKNTFDAAKRYRRVLHQQKRPVFEFEINEAQDIAAHERDQITRQLAEGANLLGSAGRVTPPTTAAARTVDVQSGVAVHLSSVVQIPSVANLTVYDAAVTTGTHNTCVYVQWRDVEVTATTDANLKGDINGTLYEGAARTKREVAVKAAYGATTAPAVTGWNTFAIAVVTHNFDTDGVNVLAKDMKQEPYGLTPGELAGRGSIRPLHFYSRAAAAEEGFLFQRRTGSDGAKLAVFNQGSVDRMILHGTGQLQLSGYGDRPPFIINSAVKVVNLNADRLDDQDGSFYLNATNLNAGTLSDARLSSNVPLKNANNVYSTSQIFNPAGHMGVINLKFGTEAGYRFVLGSIGTMEWGDGTNARDTNLYRSAAGVLKTDNRFVAGGSLTWGAGGTSIGSSADVPLKHVDNTFTGTITYERPSTSVASIIQGLITGEAYTRFRIRGDGMHNWGSGAAAHDTNLYRSATSTLRTDGAFIVGSELNVGGNLNLAGTMTGGSVPDARLSSNVALRDAANTFTANQRISSPSASVWLLMSAGDGVTNQSTGTLLYNNNVLRWAVLKNTSDNYAVARYNDAGAFIGNVMSLERASGNAMFSNALAWGGGAAIASSADVPLLSKENVFTGQMLRHGAAGVRAYGAYVTGDTADRWQVQTSGQMVWGSGGVYDTNLYRAAADTLKTDDSFVVASSLNVSGATSLASKLTVGHTTQVRPTVGNDVFALSVAESPAAGNVIETGSGGVSSVTSVGVAGLVVASNTNIGGSAVFLVDKDGQSVLVSKSGPSNWSGTAGTSGSQNVYMEAGVLKHQNLSGGHRAVRFLILRLQ